MARLSSSIPATPEAQFAAWKREIEERLRALEVGRDSWKGSGDWVDTADIKTTTSGSFVSLWKAYLERVEAKALLVRFDFQIDASTTGSFRVSIDGTDHSPIVGPIAAGTTGQKVLRWIHTQEVGDEGGHYVEIFARRDSGSGSVRVTHPYTLVQRTSSGAATDGTAWS